MSGPELAPVTLKRIIDAALVHPLSLQPLAKGELSGWRFAVKDNFAVDGLPQRAGSPALAAHSPPEWRHAALVQTCLRAGAALFGRAVMDELAYGIEGINAHDGTPIHPHDPSRVCGGSSGGCASLVAANVVDFALASDTAGSIRIPAAWCQIFGFRPAYSEYDRRGVVPLAPSFDVAGLLARDLDVVQRVDHVLARRSTIQDSYRHLRWLALPLPAHPAITQAFGERVQSWQRQVDLTWAEKPSHADTWSHTLRTIQSAEVHAQWGAWVAMHRETLAPWIAQRFQAAATVDASALAKAHRERWRVVQWWQTLLRGADVVIMPSVPTFAPRVDASADERAAVRASAMQSSALASLVGAPELSVPAPALPQGQWGISILASARKTPAIFSAASQVQALSACTS